MMDNFNYLQQEHMQLLMTTLRDYGLVRACNLDGKNMAVFCFDYLSAKRGESNLLSLLFEFGKYQQEQFEDWLGSQPRIRWLYLLKNKVHDQDYLHGADVLNSVARSIDEGHAHDKMCNDVLALGSICKLASVLAHKKIDNNSDLKCVHDELSINTRLEVALVLQQVAHSFPSIVVGGGGGGGGAGRGGVEMMAPLDLATGLVDQFLRPHHGDAGALENALAWSLTLLSCHLRETQSEASASAQVLALAAKTWAAAAGMSADGNVDESVFCNLLNLAHHSGIERCLLPSRGGNKGGLEWKQVCAVIGKSLSEERKKILEAPLTRINLL